MQKANTPVAKQEIASTWVNAVEARNHVICTLSRPAIGASVLKRQGGQHERVVHALVPGRAESPTLGRYPEACPAEIPDGVQGQRGHRPRGPALIDIVRLTGQQVLGRGRVRIPATDAESRIAAGSFANREGATCAIYDIDDARFGIDVENAARRRWNLGYLTQSRIGPLAKEVIATGHIGKRSAGEGNHEAGIDHAVASVAGTVKNLDLRRHDFRIRRLVPQPVRVPKAGPVVLLEVGQHQDKSAESPRLRDAAAGDDHARRK